jgi:1-deoxy-D-xylulose-5-phosphate reductoisomerase
MAKNIAILGSTGSIGKQTLNVIDYLGQGYKVVALTAHKNVNLLANQVRKYKPKYVAVTCQDYFKQCLKLCQNCNVKVLAGQNAASEIAQLNDVDFVLNAIVGAAGLPAVIAAAKAGKTLAIANKETLVIAGELITRIVQEQGGLILPVDSEHSAIFQAMKAGERQQVYRIILTASGGPFRNMSRADLQNVTLEQTLSHPVWDMGRKITVDSATMMNKALEVIEAHWLFDMPVDSIEILVHPESIVHSLVEFVDGSLFALLGRPDMCLPIQYALTYPTRVAGITEHIKLEEVGKLTFERPNVDTFRALVLGFEVARTGGTAAVVFNAANEAAVGEFLAGRIKFSNIVELIEDCLNKHNVKRQLSLEELLEADAWARKEVERISQEHIRA